ncbi:TPA: mitochondrial translation [Trebouxia sp. C0005]
MAALHSGRRLLDAVEISSVRDGPDDSSIAVDLADASSFVPEGTADASVADATATQTSQDGAAGDATVTASSSGRNAGASTGLTSVATSGHLQASSSSIADGTASGSRAQVNSKQHISSSDGDPAKADVTNSVDGKTAVVSFQGAGFAAKAAKGGKAPATTAANAGFEISSGPSEAKPDVDYPDWLSDLTKAGKTLGELRRTPEDERDMADNVRHEKLAQRAAIKSRNFSKAKGV